MPITLKLQDAPHGRGYHIAVKLIGDRTRTVLCDYAPWRDDEHLTPAGRAILGAVDNVNGVDRINLKVYSFDVYPAVAFDAEQVYGQVLEAVRAVVAELGETLEVSTLPPIPPPTPRERKLLEGMWP